MYFKYKVITIIVFISIIITMAIYNNDLIRIENEYKKSEDIESLLDLCSELFEMDEKKTNFRKVKKYYKIALHDNNFIDTLPKREITVYSTFHSKEVGLSSYYKSNYQAFFELYIESLIMTGDYDQLAEEFTSLSANIPELLDKYRIISNLMINYSEDKEVQYEFLRLLEMNDPFDDDIEYRGFDRDLITKKYLITELKSRAYEDVEDVDKYITTSNYVDEMHDFISAKGDILRVFESIISGEREFFLDGTDNKESIGFFTSGEYKYYPSGYEFVDVNDDYMPEMLLWLSYEDYDSIPLMVYFENDEVYVYINTHRGIRDLKVDGTAYFANGAFETGYLKILFENEKETHEILGYTINDKEKMRYYIENKEVTRTEYNELIESVNQKEDTEFRKIKDDERLDY